MDFQEIWNEAYNIYTDCNRTESGRYNDMQRFLWQKVNFGELPAADKPVMAADIMKTAAL